MVTMLRNARARDAKADQRFYGFRIPAGYVPEGQESVKMCIGTDSTGTAEVRIPHEANALVVVEEPDINPKCIGIYPQKMTSSAG
jgi:hypothetical protein